MTLFSKVQLQYSRFVSLMKVILPSLAAALLSLLVIWPQFSLFDSGFGLNFLDIDLKSADMSAMQGPRYFGTTSDNLPFSVMATTATQIDTENNVVSLDKPKADLAQKDGGSVLLLADMGLFRQQEDLLDLLGGVDLFRSDGYEVHTESIRVNVKLGTAIGDDRTVGQGPAGTIEGEGVRIFDSGDRILVTGRSRALLYAARQKDQDE